MPGQSRNDRRPGPEDEQQFQFLSQRYEQRKLWRKQPKKGSQVINQLLARKEYSQTSATASVEEHWKNAVGDSFGSRSKPGVLRQGVLEVIVQNSSVMQELIFKKRQILKKFKANDQTKDIIDLKFKVGMT